MTYYNRSGDSLIRRDELQNWIIPKEKCKKDQLNPGKIYRPLATITDANIDKQKNVTTETKVETSKNMGMKTGNIEGIYEEG